MSRNEIIMTSSPDPLGMSRDSPLTISPSKASRKITTPRKVLSDSSGNVRLQDFFLTTPPGIRYTSSSPNKSTAQTENQLSPWRIRVTVEAEREDMDNGTPSKKPPPTKRLTERTTTTTVPLKGAGDSSPSPVKKGRGRPRKSLDAPAKRNGTPKPKAAGRRKTMPVTVEEAANGASAQPASPRAGRGRPRKSYEPTVEQAEIQEDKDDACERTPTRPRSKGRRKAMTPVRFEGNSDITSVDANSVGLDEETAGSAKDFSEDLEPTLSKGRRPTRKSLEKTRLSEAQSEPTEDIGFKENENSSGMGDAPGDVENSNYEGASLDQHDEDMWRSMIRQDSVSPGHGMSESSNYDEQFQSEDNLVEPTTDPTDEHQEFDSILESEGFSMVSVSLLPSARQDSSSPAVSEEEEIEDEENEDEEEQEGEDENMKKPVPAVPASRVPVRTPLSDTQPDSRSSESARVSAQRSSAEGVDLSVSQMPSSPPPVPNRLQTRLPTQKQTPSIVFSSPALPPPLASHQPRLSPRTMDKPTDGTPKLVRVVRAGIALQGVLSPKNSSAKPILAQASSSASSTRSPKERLDDLFSGFGAGTRRELRAGLRLGEELAKRQQAVADKQSFEPTPEDDVFFREAESTYPVLPSSSVTKGYSLKLPGPGQKIEYPVLSNNQLPSPARSEPDDDADRMSWKADTPVKLEVPSSTKAQIDLPLADRSTDNSAIDETMMARLAEWQQEREAVSRQIEMASASQVIVIDSDDDEDEQQEEAEDESEDIWQTEAHFSDPVQEPSPERLEDLFPNEVVKPRRAKLPSPWRRNSQVVYSDEPVPSEDAIRSDDTAPNESDSFWQPDGEATKTAKKREERRQKKQEQEASADSNVIDSSTINPSIDSEPPSKVQRVSEDVSKPRLAEAAEKVVAEKALQGDSPSGNTAAYFESNEKSITDIRTKERNPTLEDSYAYSENDAEASLGTMKEQKSPSPDFDAYSENDQSQMSELSYEEQTEFSLPGNESVGEIASENSSTCVVDETMPPDLRRQTVINASTQKQLKNRASRIVPPQPAAPSQTAPSSWLTSLTSYIPLWRTSTPTTTAPTPSWPSLSVHFPWTTAHFHALYPLYRRQLHRPSTFPFSPLSPSAEYLNTTIPVAGWEKPFAKADCAVADAFMRVLAKRGKASTFAALTGEKRIEVVDVLEMLTKLWMGGVQRGEAKVGDGITGLDTSMHEVKVWRGVVVPGEGGERRCAQCKIREGRCRCWGEGL